MDPPRPAVFHDLSGLLPDPLRDRRGRPQLRRSVLWAAPRDELVHRRRPSRSVAVSWPLRGRPPPAPLPPDPVGWVAVRPVGWLPFAPLSGWRWSAVGA